MWVWSRSTPVGLVSTPSLRPAQLRASRPRRAGRRPGVTPGRAVAPGPAGAALAGPAAATVSAGCGERGRGQEAAPVHAHHVSPVPNGYRIVLGSSPAGMSTGSLPCGGHLAVEDLGQRLHRVGPPAVGREPGRRVDEAGVVGDLRARPRPPACRWRAARSPAPAAAAGRTGCWSARRHVVLVRRRDGLVDGRLVGLVPVGSAVAAEPRLFMASRSHSGLRLVITVSPTPVTRTFAGASANGSRFGVVAQHGRGAVGDLLDRGRGAPACRRSCRPCFSSTNGWVRMPRLSLSFRIRSTLWSMRRSVSRPLSTAARTALIATSRFGGMSSWSTPASSAITGISSGGKTFAPPMPSASVTTTPP